MLPRRLQCAIPQSYTTNLSYLRSKSTTLCPRTFTSPPTNPHPFFSTRFSSNVAYSHYRASLPRPRTFSSHTSTSRSYIRTMSSDADYASFLDKANQDTGAAEQQSTLKKSYGTRNVDTAVPKALEQVQEYYTSDADEPFEPVALKFEGGSISAGRSLFSPLYVLERIVRVCWLMYGQMT
jgi:hypothetical protein